MDTVGADNNLSRSNRQTVDCHTWTERLDDCTLSTALASGTAGTGSAPDGRSVAIAFARPEQPVWAVAVDNIESESSVA